MNFLHNIDLNGNQLLNFLLHPAAVAPANPNVGMMYFDTNVSALRPQIYIGEEWRQLAYYQDIADSMASIASLYAKQADFETLQTKVNAFLDGDVDADGVLENLKEIQSFLDTYDGTTTLSDALNTINADIGVLRGYFNSDGIAKEAAKVSGTLYIGDFEFNGSQDVVYSADDFADILNLKSLHFKVNQSTLFLYSPHGDIAPTYELRGQGAVVLTTSSENDAYTVKISVAMADNSMAGIVKTHYQDSTDGGLEMAEKSTVADRYYGVGIDAAGKLFVNVPWTDTEYSLPLATSSVRGGIKVGYAASGANLPVELSSEKAYVALTSAAIKAVDGALTRKYAGAITAGTATEYTVTHSLGTRDVVVMVYDPSTYEQVMVDVVMTTTSAVKIAFATAPAVNYRVVVIG